jgi:hypothetical protein
MSKMKYPVVIADGYDLFIYGSTDHIDLEPADIISKGIVAYDGEGYLLDLFIIKKEHTTRFLWLRWNKSIEVVGVRLHTPETNHASDLRDKLKRFLVYTGHSESDLENLLLMELIQLAVKFMPWSDHLNGESTL